MSYGFDELTTIDLVASLVDWVAALVPSRVTLADSTCMNIEFARQISDAEVARLESHIEQYDLTQIGLEMYMSSYEGDGPLLSEVARSNSLFLWWD